MISDISTISLIDAERSLGNIRLCDDALNHYLRPGFQGVGDLANIGGVDITAGVRPTR